jgi:hypothetical protein
MTDWKEMDGFAWNLLMHDTCAILSSFLLFSLSTSTKTG